MKRLESKHTLLIIAVAIAIACSLAGCYNNHSTHSTSSAHSSNSARSSKSNVSSYSLNTTPNYKDRRWPTTNSELLAIPESERWYNAWNSAESNCTIAGPVVNVYQAKQSRGQPIFINIGTKYPSSDCVSLVIWADQYDDFSKMINEVDDGGAWISVTGYLTIYNGQLQFNAGNGRIKYKWWKHG